MFTSIAGRAVVVTGATRGIGKGIARAGLQRWQRVSGLSALADGLDGRLVESGPATPVKEPAGFGVVTLGQNARLASAVRCPAVAEGGFNLGALGFKFGVAGARRRPRFGP